MSGFKQKKLLKKDLLIWLGIPLLALYISANWYQLMLIQGESMAPTYKHMQIVLLNRHNREFARGNVIAFECDGFSCVLVKRIVAEPGDTAQIVEGTLIINGKVSQVYPERGVIADPGLLAQPVTLSLEQYLVLGDNLPESIDSRYREVGIVSESDIIGKVAVSR